MEDVEIKRCECPQCGYSFDRCRKIMGEGSEVEPGPNKVCLTICLKCGTLLEFRREPDLVVREFKGDIPEPVQRLLVKAKLLIAGLKQGNPGLQ